MVEAAKLCVVRCSNYCVAVTNNALAIPSFRALWLNNLSFFMVVNAQRFVLGWLVLDGLGGGEREQGLVVFALGLPGLALVLQAGVWADRHSPRLLLIISQVLSIGIMTFAGVLVAADRMNLTWALVVAVVAGLSSVVSQPVRASLVPALVDSERLFNAIAINAIAMTMSMIFGPVMVERVGQLTNFEGAFWFMALLLVVGGVALFWLHVPVSDSRANKDRIGVWQGSVEALGHIVGDARLARLFLLLVVAGFTINPAVMVGLQALVKLELGRDASDSAPLLALMGVGIALSSAVVMRKGNMPRKGGKFQLAMMVGSTCTFLMGRATAYPQLLVLTFVMGLAGGFYINMNQGLIQSNTPQRLMGRVMGLYTLVQMGLLPIGALVQGELGARFGVGNVISGAATIGFVVVVTVFFSNKELRRLD